MIELSDNVTILAIAALIAIVSIVKAVIQYLCSREKTKR